MINGCGLQVWIQKLGGIYLVRSEVEEERTILKEGEGEGVAGARCSASLGQGETG